MATRQAPTRAIVLAAGEGKRMRSDKPKVLHDILGQAILWRVIDTLDGLDLEHIHVVIGHGAQEVRTYLSACSWKTPVSIHVQEQQLGTGHAVLQVEEALTDFTGDVLVVYGDTPLLTAKTLEGLLDEHVSQKADLSLITTIVPDAKGYGRILRSPKGAITGIVENKDASSEQKQIKEINPGMYCLRFPEVLPGLHSLSNKNEQGEYYLTDLVSWAVGQNKKLASYIGEDYQELAGINSRVDLAEAAQILNRRTLNQLALESGVTIVDPGSTWISPEVKIGQDTLILPNCWIIGDITIGRSCQVGPGTTIKGTVDVGSGTHMIHSHIEDVRVGDNCRVGPFANLRAGTVLSDEVRVGNFVEVKQSFLGLGAKASHLSYLGDTTVGNDANIGAGTIVANYDHITKLKSRTSIGDRASTGSNSVIVAPVSLGDGCFVAAGTVITKNVPAGALAVARAQQVHKEGWSESRKRKHLDQTEGKNGQKTEKSGK